MTETKHSNSLNIGNKYITETQILSEIKTELKFGIQNYGNTNLHLLSVSVLKLEYYTTRSGHQIELFAQVNSRQ